MIAAEKEGGFERCVQNNGFSLHANVSCEADERKKLEKLCRYVAQPTIANERLKLTDCGQVMLTLKTPLRDGTTHIVMSPLELLQKLAALVPRSRFTPGVEKPRKSAFFQYFAEMRFSLYVVSAHCRVKKKDPIGSFLLFTMSSHGISHTLWCRLCNRILIQRHRSL